MSLSDSAGLPGFEQQQMKTALEVTSEIRGAEESVIPDPMAAPALTHQPFNGEDCTLIHVTI